MYFNRQQVLRLCHTNEKLEVITRCKEMPVIPDIKVVDEKRMIGKRWLRRRRRRVTDQIDVK
jgi:hypothetical protein